tara:strand:+ start:118 stop:270 length:153 start_codon:yes stop_codon:yes gene_type:complete
MFYLDVARFVATNIIDVDFDYGYRDGEIYLDLSIKIPLTDNSENKQVESK